MALTPVPAKTVFQYITDDFETAWNCLARRPEEGGGGNFMFGTQAMVLLEFICRLCEQSGTPTMLGAFSTALESREKKYFTELPGLCQMPAEFTLPGSNPQKSLLATLFDLIRNGNAHQYQAPSIRLLNGDFGLALTGAGSGIELSEPDCASPKNLSFQPQGADLRLSVRPDRLFLDIKAAAIVAGIDTTSATVSQIVRPKVTIRRKTALTPNYSYTVQDVINCLKGNGHDQI